MVLEMLTYSSFSPPTYPVLACIEQGLAGRLLADPGGWGSPRLELEMRGETSQGEQLYRKETYLFIRQTLPAPLG